MNSLCKILVVDDGARNAADALSIELGELGFASVTADFEAADSVLDLIDTPSAIFVKLRRHAPTADREDALRFAEGMRKRVASHGIPVIVWDGAVEASSGGLPALLRSRIGVDVAATAF